MIEAAASGVPVVASGSRTGGGVVVPGETGVLVADYGVDSIADAVATLLQRRRSAARELGRTARAHAEENFDPARNARRIEAIYDEIAPADGSGSRSSTSTTARSSAARRPRSRS